jgi:predicted HAD superfamily phosphohydrolase
MRKPKRKRPRNDARLVPGAQTDLAEMSLIVSYVISTEHKDYLTSAGPGNLRSDASACPRGLTREAAETWLREPSETVRSVRCSTATTRVMRGRGLKEEFTRLG